MKLMLLMIITPPDSHIAKFTTRRLRKALKENVNLCVYFNGVPPGTQRTIRKDIQNNANIRIIDNYSYIVQDRDKIAAQVGKLFVTANGSAREMREGLYEQCGEIWSRELVRFKEFDLVGIVDPDFEIFQPDFIDTILEAFKRNEGLGFLSVDFSPSMEYYDSYSRENCVLEQRYHTWFCVYRRQALELENDFYYHEERNGKTRKWDHSARLQEILTFKHGFSGSVLPKEHQWKFLHYGAFAQNRSLIGFKLRLYRAFRIGKHNGFRHLYGHNSLSRAIQQFSARMYRLLNMKKYDREREHYIFESESAHD